MPEKLSLIDKYKKNCVEQNDFIIDDTYVKSKGKRVYNYLGYPVALPQEIFTYFNGI